MQRTSTPRAFINRQWRRVRMGRIAHYLEVAERIPGWRPHDEAEALARVARRMPDDAVIVEIGVFLGSGAVVLAGARKIAGTGIVHCVDPFDASGDEYSVPIYREILRDIESSQFEVFTRTIDSLELDDQVRVHRGTAENVGRTWDRPIDLLVLDGDHSPRGARSAFDVWEPWLRRGGTLVITNSVPRAFELDHDGNFLIASERVVEPSYQDIRVIGATTFAVKH